ncbi:SDR family NAD(P)-dependent oxidoreductase [Streptomyces sp. NPDC055966]|uniref:SDR family NAD(P)-dependent oxidoreductase n=1 Tax=unclassified Streptomyces TaxID=2593676 RepID=UPI0035D5BB10
MPANSSTSQHQAWVITGPTSGIGYRTALELTSHGTLVLVGRDAAKLEKVRAEIEAGGSSAVAVVADMSDILSVRRAAGEITQLGLPIAGVLNNAGIFPIRASTSPQGWDRAFATNHLGPLAFTEALIPSLPDGANVVFVVSAVEDPERTISVRAGYRGSRYLSAEATARGEYLPGGSTKPGFDAYATSKQGGIAAAFSLAREFPRLRFRAVEPGVTPGSNLGRDMSAAAVVTGKALSPLLSLLPHFSTPKRAAQIIARVLTDDSADTGTYYDEKGRLMAASRQVSDPAYSDRYIAESRALLATVPAAQLRP